MTDEDLVRERVMAYLQDRHDFELMAVQHDRQGRPHRTKEDGAADRASFREFQVRHRTAAAATESMPMMYADPPSVDPATTEVVSAKVRGSTAMVVTAEVKDDDLPPFRYRYLLELEGGNWLLADRQSYNPDTRRWLKGLL